MNDREYMDTQDAWLLRLYEGNGDVRPPEFPEAAEEDEAIREMKALLEARPKKSPDAQSVSNVLAAARGGAVAGVRRDRSPAPRSRSVGLRVGTASALVVLLIGLVGMLKPDAFPPDALPFVTSPASPTLPESASLDASVESDPVPLPATDESSDASPQSTTLSDAPAPRPDIRTLGADRQLGRYAAASDPNMASRRMRGLDGTSLYDVPGWDDQGHVIELHQRIEMIGAGVDRGWEAPAVPLEMLPVRGTSGGIIPAGRRR